MEIHAILKIAGGVGALLLFIPLAMDVIKTGGGSQSFSTWFLWASLDTTLTVSTLVQHGNFLLPLGYAVGGWALTALLVAKGRFVWTRLDNAVLALVIGCLIGWKIGGAKIAIIATVTAVCIAGIPGFIELWRKPDRFVGNIWFGYGLANLLAFFGGTAMTVEERLAPGVFTILSLFMVAAGWRKMEKPRTENF